MRLLFVPALVTLIGVTIGCGSPTSVETSPVGVYTLQTVNGKALPQLVSKTSTGDLEVMSASLTLREDKSYSSTYTYRAVGTTQTIKQDVGGTWAVSGSTVTYYPAGSSPTNVTSLAWSGETLTLVDNAGSVPVTLVFKR